MVRIGKIVATHGLGGDVIMTHNTGDPKWLKPDVVLHVAVRKDSRIPFFVEAVKRADVEEAVLRLDATDSMEKAKALVGREVYAEEKDLEQGASDSPLLWIGFELIDQKHGNLGVISDIFQTAHQWLATVHFQGKEVLVPLIDQTLLKIDLKGRQIQVAMPEGLLEVYL